jgi:Uma2 family endonuclease
MLSKVTENTTAPDREEASMAQTIPLPPLVRGQWTKMTYEDFLAWAPEGLRTEWRDGEGIVYVSASDRHQAVIELVLSLLSGFVRVFGLGRVGFAPYAMLLQPGGPHREPDVLFVQGEHLDRWTAQRLHGPADLVVEVLSEDTAREDRGLKRDEYEALGVSEYVMIDARPGRQEFIYQRLDDLRRYQPVAPDEHGRYHSAVLTGFWLNPEWFRRDPLPDVEDLLLTIAPDAYEAWILAKLRSRRGAVDIPLAAPPR